MHFRNCEESAWEDVQAAVQATLAEQPELRLTRGRKVLELRPEVSARAPEFGAHIAAGRLLRLQGAHISISRAWPDLEDASPD